MLDKDYVLQTHTCFLFLRYFLVCVISTMLKMMTPIQRVLETNLNRHAYLNKVTWESCAGSGWGGTNNLQAFSCVFKDELGKGCEFDIIVHWLCLFHVCLRQALCWKPCVLQAQWSRSNVDVKAAGAWEEAKYSYFSQNSSIPLSKTTLQTLTQCQTDEKFTGSVLAHMVLGLL